MSQVFVITIFQSMCFIFSPVCKLFIIAGKDSVVVTMYNGPLTHNIIQSVTQAAAR